MDLKGILGGFLEGWINIFGEDAKNMIRATKGKSMDGWMDGWMDGEVLIIGKVVGWSGRVPKGLSSFKVR